MRTIFKGEQADDTWRALRLGCATGSGFGFVLAAGKGSAEAVTRRNYRIRLALEILTGAPEENGFTTKDIQTGIDREPLARAAFEMESGLLVEEVSFIKLDSAPVGVSPDGLIAGQPTGYEVKCPSKAIHFEYLSMSTVPAVYVPQVQGGMLVTGYESWYFHSYNPDFPPELQSHWFKVERDEAYIKRLDAALVEFNFEVRQTVAEMRQMIEQRKAK
jgi:hypothetical protein